jgi:hypothetical protein
MRQDHSMLDDSAARRERPEPRLIRHSRDAEIADDDGLSSGDDSVSNVGSLPSPAPDSWRPADSTKSFVKYARRLKRNGHRVTGYAVNYALEPDERALVAAWADVGVLANYVVVDHEIGRVEGYRTWGHAYAATCEWDGGTLAPSVEKFRS